MSDQTKNTGELPNADTEVDGQDSTEPMGEQSSSPQEQAPQEQVNPYLADELFSRAVVQIVQQVLGDPAVVHAITDNTLRSAAMAVSAQSRRMEMPPAVFPTEPAGESIRVDLFAAKGTDPYELKFLYKDTQSGEWREFENNTFQEASLKNLKDAVMHSGFFGRYSSVYLVTPENAVENILAASAKARETLASLASAQ